jgi:phage recombination protein Bet
MNALTKYEGGALALQEADLLNVLASSLYPGAALDSIRLVLGYCKAAGFDPMQKPVHIVPMWDGKAKQMRDVVMPGIGLYRTQAARSGCAGVTEPEFGPDVTEKIGGVEVTYPQWCRVTVKRRQATGDVDEFTAKEFWRENYAVKGGAEKSIAPNAMWQKRPYGQLAKCAEAQALRKAFPEVGSQPAAEEMEGKAIEGEVIDASTGEVIGAAKSEPPAPPAWPEDAFKAQFSRWEKAVHAGLKTTDDILALAKSKGALAPAQEQQIRGIKAAQQEAEPDPFVADMEAAEQGSAS